MKITPEMVREAEAHFPYALAEGPAKAPRWQWFANFYNHALANPGTPCPCCNVTPDGDIMDHLPQPPAEAQPVGEVFNTHPMMGSGYMHFFLNKERLPTGTKLYTTPPSAPDYPITAECRRCGVDYRCVPVPAKCAECGADLPPSAPVAAMREPVLRIYAEGSMRTVVEWCDGSRDLPDGDHELFVSALAQQPAPSAPVGVEERQALANVPFGWVKDAPSGIRSTLDFTTLPGVANGWRVEGYRVVTLYSLPHLRQQPAAVDEAMVERAAEAYLQEAKRQGFQPSEAWARSQQAMDWMRAALTAALAQQPAPSAPVGVPPALTPEQAHEMAPDGLSWDEAGAWAMGYEACRQRALAQQPAAGVGEEIMVNAAHDVYTLPLQPSGLLSGPRFVVHVPAPEQPATVDEAASMRDLLQEVRQCFTRDDDLPDNLLPRIDDVIAAHEGEREAGQ